MKGQADIFFCGPRTVLACDLRLKHGESKTVSISCQLPPDLPPSYSGTTIKYFYFANLVAQKTIKDEPQTMKFRFKVINPTSGISVTKLKDLRVFNYHTQITELKENQLDQDWSEKPELVIKDSHTKNTINALFKKHGHTVSININKGQHRLVRFSIEKTVFQLGDVIKGIFDFTENVIPCYQVSVILQVEEEIDPKVANPIRSQLTVKKVINQLHECSHETLKTYFSFYIPVDAAQSFQTELVTLRWVLRFEFITAMTWDDRKGEKNIDYTPKQVEVLNWTLPIRVLVPSFPLQSNLKLFTTEDTPKACLLLK